MKNIALTLVLAGLMIVLASPVFALSVGDPAPDFTLTDTEGVEHTLSEYQGKVVFLSFMGAT
jgi:peroxiredoxin